MAHIFLSYSRDDQPVAARVAAGLERAGFTVWWDQSLAPGEAYDKVTEKALEEAAAVVVLWSRRSVESRWVRAEATQANARGVLVPAMIEPPTNRLAIRSASIPPAWRTMLVVTSLPRTSPPIRIAPMRPWLKIRPVMMESTWPISETPIENAIV